MVVLTEQTGYDQEWFGTSCERPTIVESIFMWLVVSSLCQYDCRSKFQHRNWLLVGAHGFVFSRTSSTKGEVAVSRLLSLSNFARKAVYFRNTLFLADWKPWFPVIYLQISSDWPVFLVEAQHLVVQPWPGGQHEACSGEPWQFGGSVWARSLPC